MRVPFKLKQHVARDGLILIGLLLIGAIWSIGSVFWDNATYTPDPTKVFVLHIHRSINIEDLALTGLTFIIIGYPLLLVMRFIRWAIGVLRQEDTTE